MATSPRAFLFAALLTAGVAPLGSLRQMPAQTPPRDVRGTARISGMVVDNSGAPVEGVTVKLMSSDWRTTTVLSDTSGRFAFTALPAALYFLGGEKSGFMAASFGALRPGGDGTPIALANRQRLDDLTLTLIRMGAISGRIRRPDGAPAAGAHIQITPNDGKGIAASGQTDADGMYRIGDLYAGQYKVQAMPASYDVGVPVFHPGTTSFTQAATVRVSLEEERKGIDILLVDERPAGLTGVVLDTAGLPAPGVQVLAIPVAWGGGRGRLARTSGAGGEFSLDGIFPGRYALRAYVTPAPEVLLGDPATLWAAETVDVPRDTGAVLTLRLQPPVVFSGRIRFSGHTPPPSDLSAVRVDLQQDGWMPTPVTVRADGTFARSVLPGSYHLDGFVPETGRRWQLRSAVKDGRDLLDTPVEFSVATGGVTDVELTFSDQQTTLSGVVTAAAGAPYSACHVVVFSADRAFWSEDLVHSAYSRRLANRRPATNGRFAFEGLPPGDYFLAVVAQLDPALWRTPVFLDTLAERATRVTLREGDRRTQDLRVTGR